MTGPFINTARGSGGRFVRPTPPVPDIPEVPAAPQLTATQQLAALKELRRQNGGFIVPPPAGLAGASLVYPVGAGTTDGLVTLNRGAQAAEQWFRAIVAAGGSPMDLQRAWESWHPTAVGNANPKPGMRAAFEALCAKAGPPHVELRRRAEAEALPVKVLASTRHALRLAEDELAAEMRRHIEPLQKRVDGLKAVIAQLEAQQS